jgi:hypothetical protein
MARYLPISPLFTSNSQCTKCVNLLRNLFKAFIFLYSADRGLNRFGYRAASGTFTLDRHSPRSRRRRSRTSNIEPPLPRPSRRCRRYSTIDGDEDASPTSESASFREAREYRETDPRKCRNLPTFRERYMRLSDGLADSLMDLPPPSTGS